MVSQRNIWKERLGCEEYICPRCKRDKGMLYLFPDGSIRYVCFCGSNVSVDWIKKHYDFDKKKFIKKIKKTR